MRVLVAGSRHVWNDALVFDELDRYQDAFSVKFTDVISGMASGVDTLACYYAWSRRLVLHSYPAQWSLYHRGAGFVRNRQMLNEGRPDVVFAFARHDSRGTLDMIRLVRRAMATGSSIKLVEVMLPNVTAKRTPLEELLS